MTQEQKELLLKDLCSRLPYEVKVQDIYYNSLEPAPIWLIDINAQNVRMFADEGYQSIEYIKPYLFPLESMTDAQCKELRNLIHEHFTLEDEFNEGICFKTYGDILVWLDEKPINQCYFIFDWLNKNHFDYRGLIPMGLAIDCTNLNIYE